MSKPSGSRLHSIDIVRGLVMVFMLLDHTRDFLCAGFNPEMLGNSSPWFFYTRWITHFCAPTFVFLAGTGAWLSLSRGQTIGSLRWFLISRGVWLMILELTIIRFGWNFDIKSKGLMLQVIWALGASMVLLSLFVSLPSTLIACLGATIIALHNLGDKVTAATLGGDYWVWWDLLHTSFRTFKLGDGWMAFNVYPILPWFGIMALGYGLGPLFLKPAATRRTGLILWFAGLLVIFLVLRFLNGYGDNQPWKVWQHKDSRVVQIPTRVKIPESEIKEERSSLDRPTTRELTPDEIRKLWEPNWPNIAHFLNPQKYPPSLHYTCMTLSGMFLMLWIFDYFSRGIVQSFLLAFGRVPLFFYILHLYLAHALGEYAAPYLDKWMHDWGWLGEKTHLIEKANFFTKYTDRFVVPVYVGWLIALIILFPLCFWYDKVKRKYGGILRYL